MHTQEFVQLDNQEVKDLVDSYIAGDSEAVTALLDIVRPLVLSELNKMKVPASVDEDDVISELNIVILESLPKYDPTRASFVTWVYHIVHRRISRIVSTLSGRKVYKNEGVRSPRQLPNDIDMIDSSMQEINVEEYEVLSDAAALIKSSFTPYERRVYLDYLQGIPTTIIVDKANAYLDKSNPGHKKEDNVSVNNTIAECTERLKEEFRQRNALDFVGELQKELF